jgi:hypothetical protein
VFDIYTIIFLALAVFIFLRLRSVLGQRTGRERPPYDPYSAREAARSSSNDNVVSLPPRASDAAPTPAAEAEPADRWKGIAEQGSAAALGLDAVLAQDPSFDPRHFLTGAQASLERRRPVVDRRLLELGEVLVAQRKPCRGVAGPATDATANRSHRTGNNREPASKRTACPQPQTPDCSPPPTMTQRAKMPMGRRPLLSPAARRSITNQRPGNL